MVRHAHFVAGAMGILGALLVTRPALAIDDPGAIPVPEAPPPPPSPDSGVRSDPDAPRDPSAPDRFALDPSRGSMGSFFSEPGADLGVTLSMSPLHLFLPMIDVQGEVGILRKLSVDGVFGYTRAKVLDPAGSGNAIRRPLFVGAVHGRYYMLGNYRGGFPLVIGPKIIRVDSDQLLDLALFNGTNSVGLEMLVGFKKVIRGLVTAEFLGGIDYLLARPTPAHPSAPGVGDRPRGVLVSFAFNIGVSF